MKCQHCHKRKATIHWLGAGDVMNLIHGWYEMWCKRCALEAQIEYARKHKDDLKNLLKEWKNL